ncbi:MAG: MupG family TIM beta-alpha barrel fold protein [Fusobacteriaceae bacterium]
MAGSNKVRKIGISVFPDFDDMNEIKNYISKAKKYNYDKVFTSILLGSYNFDNNGKSNDGTEFSQLFELCKSEDIEISTDISRKIFEDFGARLDDLSPFVKRKIMTIRLDGGFDFDEIIKLTNNKNGVKIELNASHTTSKTPKLWQEQLYFLEKLSKEGNTNQVSACFNYYPRPDTGHSLEDVQEVTNLFDKYGIEVSAFVSNQNSKAVLLKNSHGLPTLEKHRYIQPYLSAQELFSIGVNTVIIGNSLAFDYELQDLGRVKNLEYIEIPVIYNRHVTEEVKQNITQKILETRPDQPEFIIRTDGTKDIVLEPNYCVPRKKYAISLDNNKHARYTGEFEIALKNYDRDENVNVLGEIFYEAYDLLEQIKFGRNKFKVKEYMKII